MILFAEKIYQRDRDVCSLCCVTEKAGHIHGCKYENIIHVYYSL